MRVFYKQIWCTNYFCLRRKLESYLPSNDECLREIEMAEDKEMHAEGPYKSKLFIVWYVVWCCTNVDLMKICGVVQMRSLHMMCGCKCVVLYKYGASKICGFRNVWCSTNM